MVCVHPVCEFILRWVNKEGVSAGVVVADCPILTAHRHWLRQSETFHRHQQSTVLFFFFYSTCLIGTIERCTISVLPTAIPHKQPSRNNVCQCMCMSMYVYVGGQICVCGMCVGPYSEDYKLNSYSVYISSYGSDFYSTCC